MEVYVRGARSSSRDWVRAQEIPASELPPLDEKQRAAARRENISEERYARTVYAQQLTGQATLRRLQKFGHWLEGKIQERNSGGRIDSIELDTFSGKLHIEGVTGKEPYSFELDEDLVERFLTTGDADLESGILRVAEIFMPRDRVAKAS
jgi:hypothetical protein